MCSTTREAQYTKEEFGSALADLGWPVKRVYRNGQPVNVVEYNGVAYYANSEVTPVHSSDNIDNESARSWTHTDLQSGVEFSAGVTVFQDLKGDYYTIDTQHGRFEKFVKNEYHIDEFNIDLEPQNKQKKGRKLRWN